jgi:hypothetical protein
MLRFESRGKLAELPGDVLGWSRGSTIKLFEAVVSNRSEGEKAGSHRKEALESG